ncbi:MAG TPA: nitroreductase [Acidimicrobiaceae bacterium]|nr:nitroreductase [Acidimicrobiaceae bacterium]
MSFSELARRRRMTRAFLPDAVAEETLHRVLDAARRVPSAGNAQGFDLVVLVGAAETARYWDATLPADRRAGFAWPGLPACPVLVTVWANPDAYTARYAEPDKAATGLGDRAAWHTPYWLVDASFAALALQYAAIDEGLGVLFFAMFGHADAVRAALGVPAGREPVGTVAVGHPDPAGSPPGAGAARPRRPLLDGADAVVHRGCW